MVILRVRNKPHSSNDAQRKLHSCPLLLIRKPDSENVSAEGERRRKTSDHKHSSSKKQSDSENVRVEYGKSTDFVPDRKERITKSPREGRPYASAESVCHDSIYKCRNVASKLTEEERAGKLWEM
ncbi:hypothetical protein POTOM_052143 [Populus tomentosa]|uniref:Uncharacterized protein n=1 Tax=Populus tomentosa TaxID=118781 RepID=A0A8X8C032_POPTO|nr:hypothetical protein POTOM_052143 [Populus tomentosa]